jgi:hypothetical protein
MADRMKTLERDIVNVVHGFTRISSPIHQSLAEAVPDFLLLFVQYLLRHLLPEETQIPSGRNHAQADRLSRREKKGPLVTVLVIASEKLLDGFMCEVASGENVRDCCTNLPRGAPALGEVRFNESAMAASQFAEGMQRFDDSGTLGPSAPRASRQRNDGSLAFPKRG